MTDEDLDDAASILDMVQCLQLLAEEAGSLKLARTRAALRTAIATCETESLLDGNGLMSLRNSAVLH